MYSGKVVLARCSCCVHLPAKNEQLLPRLLLFSHPHETQDRNTTVALHSAFRTASACSSSSVIVRAQVSYATRARIYCAGGKTTTERVQSLIDQRLHNPSAKIVGRRRCAESLRRDPMGVENLLRLWPEGGGGGNLRNASRCYTTINQHSKIWEDHPCCTIEFGAILNSKRWGYTWGNHVEQWGCQLKPGTRFLTPSNQTLFTRLFKLEAKIPVATSALRTWRCLLGSWIRSLLLVA
jgi:hypothetical protein